MDKQLEQEYELSDNVHPNLDGSPWGWVIIKGTKIRVATYSGREEKQRCRQLIAGATSSSTVKELEREVERLKGLIETNHKYWYKRTYNEFGAEQSWQQFKTENNL